MEGKHIICIVYNEKFKRQYKRLPDNIKELAEQKEIVFRKKPFHSSLKTHKLHGRLDEY